MAKADIHVLTLILKSGGKIVPHRVYKDSEILRWGHRAVAWSTADRGWVLLNTPEALRVYERFQRRERHRVDKSWDNYAANRDPGERLTPDITIRGRRPTPGEYREHMHLLNDVAAGGRRIFDHWTGKDMSDLQHEVWVAVHRQGLVKQDHAGVHRLTPYGVVYLRQRTSPSRDASPLTKRSSAPPPLPASRRQASGGRAAYLREIVTLLKSQHGLSTGRGGAFGVKVAYPGRDGVGCWKDTVLGRRPPRQIRGEEDLPLHRGRSGLRTLRDA